MSGSWVRSEKPRARCKDDVDLEHDDDHVDDGPADPGRLTGETILGTPRRAVSVQLDRQVLDAVDQVGGETVGLTDEAHVRRLRQHLLEHHLDLHLRERGAEAVVRAAATERDVLVR